MPDSLLGLDLPRFLVLWAGASIAVELVVLRWRGSAIDLRDTLTSMLLGLVWTGIRVVGAKVLFLGAWVWVWQHLALFDLDHGDPRTWLAYWLIGDLVYYWTHRLEHRSPLLWASHLVHHSSTRFNLATAVRQPWTEVFYKPIVAFWAPLLGFHPAMYVFVGALSLAVGQWQHLEWFPKVRWLDAVVMSPSNHRVHHGTNPEYLDRNFGGSLVVWDRLFGTYTPEVAPPVYGVLGYEPPTSPLRLSLGGYPALVASARTGHRSDRSRAGRGLCDRPVMS